MTSLADFLLARIAETEAAARADDSTHMAPIWADYVFAECDAKRRVLAEAKGAQREAELMREKLRSLDQVTLPNLTAAESAHARLSAWVQAVRIVGLAYADHSDYREEWRP